MIDYSWIARNIRQPRRRWLLLILVIYLFLATSYSIATPLFEAPDENLHFFTIKEIALTNRLPATNDSDNEYTEQEAAQPPLYYLLTSVLSRLFGENNVYQALWPNPAVRLGDPGSPQNLNAFIHGPEEAWPWRGLTLEVHMLRFLSAISGLGTLLCIYGAGRLVWPNAPEKGLFATSLVAFIPQFAFLHGAITNDVLIVFLCSFALWQLLRMWYIEMSWSRLALLGLTIGAAILTKTAGLLLLPFSLGFVTIAILREERNQARFTVFRSWFFRVGLVVVIALIISGWSLWRNWQLYGDITATNQHLLFMGEDRHYSLFKVLGESSGLWASLFAVFGWFNIIPPRWVYLAWDGIILASVAGFVRSLVQKRPSQGKAEGTATLGTYFRHPRSFLEWNGLPGVLLFIWILMVYAGLVSFMMRVPAGQGRLLFPALVPFSLALVYGLERLRLPAVTLAAIGIALITSIYCLFFVIPPAYSRPSIMLESEIPVNATRYDVALGQGLTLLAAEVETPEVHPGDMIWLTLYWRADNMPASSSGKDAPMEVLELLGQNDDLVGKLQSYHGRGLYPASLWKAGDIIADRLAVEVNEDVETPVQVRINVKLVGEFTSMDAGTAKVIPFRWPELSETFLARLGNIQLVDAKFSPEKVNPGDSVNIELEWQVLDPPTQNLATFVHLGEPGRPPVAQGDSLPVAGHYPTLLWEKGERFKDQYHLEIPEELPSGAYPILIGMYDPADGVRLPLIVDGERQPNDAYQVGILIIKQ